MPPPPRTPLNSRNRTTTTMRPPRPPPALPPGTGIGRPPPPPLPPLPKSRADRRCRRPVRVGLRSGRSRCSASTSWAGGPFSRANRPAGYAVVRRWEPRGGRVRPCRGIVAPTARSGHLVQPAGRDVEDEAVDGHTSQERVRAQDVDLFTQVRLEVGEASERDRDGVGDTPLCAATRSRRSSSSTPCRPHPVCSMTTIISVPRSSMLTISERMTSSVTRPPALRMMCASPVRRPSASSTSRRASMQATMASLDSGARSSAERSNASA